MTLPLASTVIFDAVYDPAATPLLARVVAILPLEVPSIDTEPVMSPVAVIVIAVAHLLADVALPVNVVAVTVLSFKRTESTVTPAFVVF